MKAFHFLASVALGLSAALMPTQAGAAVVDVNTIGATNVFYGGAQINCCGALAYNSVAAVVTVGISGQLSAIDLQLAGEAPSSLTMYLLPVVGNTPGQSLGSAFASINVLSPQWTSGPLYPITTVDLSALGLSFNAGDRFALAFVSNTSNVVTGWATPGISSTSVVSFDRASATAAWDTNVLGSGAMDVALRTYVTPVPLPAAAWFLLSGIGGLGALARRRRAASIDGASALSH